MSAAAPIAASAAKAMAIPSRVKNPHTGGYIPLSSTPGGSLYGTTPGGTRIHLGVTTDSAKAIPEEVLKKSAVDPSNSPADASKGDVDEDELFEME